MKSDLSSQRISIPLTLLLLLLQSSLAALEQVTKVLDLSDRNDQCTIKATTLYLSVLCPAGYILYSHVGAAFPALVYETAELVESIHETLDQGVSFIQADTLHHFDSLGAHSEQPSRGSVHYFLDDDINLLRNDAQSYAKFYLDTSMMKSLVLPGGLPYEFSANKDIDGIISVLACTIATNYCQFFDIESSPDFTMTRMATFDMSGSCTAQLVYTGQYVAHLCGSRLKIYQVSAFELTEVYSDSTYVAGEIKLQQISSTNSVNLFLSESGNVSSLQWSYIDAFQITGTSNMYISQRAVFDQHFFDFVFPYSDEHSALHTDLIQDDLKSYAATTEGVFMLGNFGTGIAIYHQIITVQTDNVLEVFENGLKTCPAQFYDDAGTCLACSVGCEFCETADVCQQCSTGFLLDSTGQCVCDVNQYQLGAECITCSENCDLCDEVGCLECVEGFMLTDELTCQVFSCPAGQYEFNFDCFACDAGCTKCHLECASEGVCDVTTTCTQCDANYELLSNECVACAASQFYLDNQCVDCRSPCDSCSSAQLCVTCADGYLIKEAGSGVCEVCDSGTYFSDGACVTCGDNCLSCSGAGECSLCAIGYIIGADGFTCEACPSGTFKNLSEECQSCPEDCEVCTSQFTCDTCKVTTLFDPLAVKCSPIVCGPQTYLQGYDCLMCPVTCTECGTGCAEEDLTCGEPPICTTCQETFELKEAGVCLGCTTTQYWETDSSTCIDCESNCEQCTASGCAVCHLNLLLVEGGICEACPENTYYENGVCEVCDGDCNDCTTNQYWANVDSLCVDCADNCDECTVNGCVTCQDQLINNAGVCESCPSKSYYGAGLCVLCADNCDECSSDGCTTCQDQLVINAGICETCPDKSYFKDDLCIDCGASCLECTETACVTCDANTLISDDALFCGACPTATYFEGDACLACTSDCDVCAADACTTCQSGFFNNSGVCESCTAGTYLSEEACVTCASNCEECTGADSCQVCTENYVLEDSLCIFQCGPEQYESGDQCEFCLEGCDECVYQDCSQSESASCSTTVCTTCSSTFHLNDGLCLQCAAGSYLDALGSCESCSTNCYKCVDVTECTECTQGFTVDDNNQSICLLDCTDEVNETDSFCTTGVAAIVIPDVVEEEEVKTVTAVATDSDSENQVSMQFSEAAVIVVIVGIIFVFVILLVFIALICIAWMLYKTKNRTVNYQTQELSESQRKLNIDEEDIVKIRVVETTRRPNGLSSRRSSIKQDSTSIPSTKRETPSLKPYTRRKEVSNRKKQDLSLISSLTLSEAQESDLNSSNVQTLEDKKKQKNDSVQHKLEPQAFSDFLAQAHVHQFPSFNNIPLRNAPGRNTQLRIGDDQRETQLTQLYLEDFVVRQSPKGSDARSQIGFIIQPQQAATHRASGLSARFVLSPSTVHELAQPPSHPNFLQIDAQLQQELDQIGVGRDEQDEAPQMDQSPTFSSVISEFNKIGPSIQIPEDSNQGKAPLTTSVKPEDSNPGKTPLSTSVTPMSIQNLAKSIFEFQQPDFNTVPGSTPLQVLSYNNTLEDGGTGTAEEEKDCVAHIQADLQQKRSTAKKPEHKSAHRATEAEIKKELTQSKAVSRDRGQTQTMMALPLKTPFQVQAEMIKSINSEIRRETVDEVRERGVRSAKNLSKDQRKQRSQRSFKLFKTKRKLIKANPSFDSFKNYQ